MANNNDTQRGVTDVNNLLLSNRIEIIENYRGIAPKGQNEKAQRIALGSS